MKNIFGKAEMKKDPIQTNGLKSCDAEEPSNIVFLFFNFFELLIIAMFYKFLLVKSNICPIRKLLIICPGVLRQKWKDELKKNMPEFREEKLTRYEKEYGLPDYDTQILTQTKQIADLFEQTVALGADAKKVSNWLMGETMRLSREKNMDLDKIKITSKNLAAFLAMVEKKEISGTVAKEVFEVMFMDNVDPIAYVEDNKLKTECDDGKLNDVILQIIKDNPKCVEEYRGGKIKAIGALVGQTMKAMGGKADPVTIRQIIEDELS